MVIRMKKLWQTFLSLYRKYEETFWYLVFGGLTTLLNIAVFFVMFECMHIDKVTANLSAWAAGVLFAFVTNKLFVFHSQGWKGKKLAWEFVSFVSARVFSGVFDMVFLLAFTGWIVSFPEMPVKIVSNIIVIIMNYVFSKWIVFRKKGRLIEK